MTKSEIFSMYNKARAAAKKGKLDAGRVNRALGVLQSKQSRGYQTTIKSCNCEDHKRHPQVACKHMVAKMIETRIEQKQSKVQPQQQMIIEVTYAGYSPADAFVWGAYDKQNKVEEVVINGMKHSNPGDAIQNLVDQGWKFVNAQYMKRYPKPGCHRYMITLQKEG